LAGKRNREETIRRLLATVGDILKEKGYAGLGVNKISARAGVHKKLIYYYFGSLNELVKAYIRQKDYWLPLFDAFQWPATLEKDDVKALFVDLLEEQFRFFYQEPEMQKLILWQISDVSPLMRHISEMRELEGAKFLALTDPYFEIAEVDFRSVVALLVGGIYYIVLHACHNKSSVCGIDINKEQDYAKLLKTIRQILNWSWSTAPKKTIPAPVMIGERNMRYELDEMEKLVTAYLYKEEWNAEEEISWQIVSDKLPRAVMEGALVLEPGKLPMYIRWHQEGLVELANSLYDRLLKAPSERLQVLFNRVRSLLEFIERSFKDEAGSYIEIPNFLWKEMKGVLSEKLDKIMQGLNSLELEASLVEVALIPLANWLDERVFILPTFSQYRYVLWYSGEIESFLEQRHKDDRKALLCKFIEVNFNHLRSFGYWIRVIEEELGQNPGNPLVILKRLRRHVLQTPVIPSAAYSEQVLSLRQQLETWVDEEISLIAEGWVLASGPAENRLKINLPVAAIAYLNKLLYKHRFFAEENQSLIIRHMVDHFSSMDTENMSINSYSSKYRSKLPSDSTARLIRKLLKPMLEEVDKVLS